MKLLHGAAGVGGLALLAATAHATISAGGGYGTAHSWVTMAIAAGVGISALVVGAAWSGRRGLAKGLVLTIVAGELFGLISTAERLVVGREALQAPLRTAAEDYAKAAQRVADAAAAVAKLPATSPRLEAAVAKKDTADRAATEKSAERGCRDNCRQLLQQQVEETGREITAARAALASSGESAKGELDRARAALGALRPPESATPLADRVGMPAWVLDLVTAALGSIAANGMACFLIAFAGHRGKPEPGTTHHTRAPAAVTTIEAQVEPEPLSALKCIEKFAFDHLYPANGGEDGADLAAIEAGIKRWCAARQIAPPATSALGQAMADLFAQAGIEVEKRGRRYVARGIRLVEPAALPAPR